MKYILFALFSISFATTLNAQQLTEGTIRYKQTLNMHKRLTGEQERFKQYVPEFQTTQYQLHFNQTASLYKEFIDPNEDLENMQRGGRFRFQMGGSGELYRNFEDNQRLRQTEFNGKRYLIEGKLEPAGWKVSGESKIILGMPCMKATRQDTSRASSFMMRGGRRNQEAAGEEQPQPILNDIEAWFTPAIPVAIGPGTYGQLPGAILEIRMNQDELVITAVEIDRTAPKEKDLEAPTKGNEITEEAFRELQQEFIQKIRAERQNRND